VGNAAEPLGATLRHWMTLRGMSIRRLARELHRLEPTVKFDSWHRSLRRYLDPDAPTQPTRNTARLIAQALDAPPDTFVRPRENVYQRQKREIAELRKRLEAQEEKGE
jgi:transcriptional regulator with XRE-family HTH domain